MAQIDFEAKTDHDLLVITVQTCNEISEKLDNLNGTVRTNSLKLAILETQQGCEAKQTSWYRNNSHNKIIGGISGAIALLVAVAFGAGKVLGWW